VSRADIEQLERDARSGEPAAQYALGARLLVGSNAPYAPREGEEMLRRAAAQGHVEALLLTAVLCARSADWTGARTFLEQAKQKGDQSATNQLEVLRAFDPEASANGIGTDWRFTSPRIGVIKSFLPQPVCDWIIARARPRLRNVQVNNPKGAPATVEYRSNTGAGFSLIDTDVVLQAVNARIAAAIGVPADHQEPTNVLHYATREEYRPHFDFIDPGVAQFGRELSAFGQRTTTFLVYLNGDFDGGETDFPRLDWRFKGGAGDALVFWNVDEEGRPERQTLHAGLAPRRGEKWLLSKWLRNRPLPLI
jgi:prolyl 4-hydroxylase